MVGPALWSNSFLPAEYQATSVITTDMAVDKLVANIRNPRSRPAQQREQLDLLAQLNQLHLAQRDGDAALEAQIQAMETAFQMQSRGDGDVRHQPRAGVASATRTATRPSRRSCLLARRLVEHGVRFVSVYYTSDNNQPWDTHTNHNERHRKLCADGDRAAAALIADLKQRGLLDDTLVVWGGEFGRTPMREINDKAPRSAATITTPPSPCCLAGGGVKRRPRPTARPTNSACTPSKTPSTSTTSTPPSSTSSASTTSGSPTATPAATSASPMSMEGW